jgi:hypothetical protein
VYGVSIVCITIPFSQLLNVYRRVINALLFQSTSVYVNMSRVDMSEVQRNADTSRTSEWMVARNNEKMIRYGVTVGRTGVCNLVTPNINAIQTETGERTIMTRRITVQPPVGELSLIASRLGYLYGTNELNADYFNKTLTFTVRAPGRSE